MSCKSILLLCSLLSALAAQAEPVAPPNAAPWALLTIADGDVTVLRGRMRFAAAEGQRLEPQDIVHTAGDARVARLEFGDGQVLDLGPATKVLLQPSGAAWPKERAVTAYIAQGWAKLRAPRGALQPRAPGLASALLDISPAEASTVLAHIEAQAAFAYIESGQAALLEYRGDLAPRALQLGEGQAYSRGNAGARGSTTSRPAAAQLGATPRALADSLPLRAALWQRHAAPLADATQTAQAAELAPWLESEAALRAGLRARFADPARASRAAGKLARLALAKARAPARVAVLAAARLHEAAPAAPERLVLSGSLVVERLAERANPPATATATAAATTAAPARRTQARAGINL